MENDLTKFSALSQLQEFQNFSWTLPLEVISKGGETFPYFVPSTESATFKKKEKERKKEEAMVEHKKVIDEDANVLEKVDQDNVDNDQEYSPININENDLKVISEFVWFDSFR